MNRRTAVYLRFSSEKQSMTSLDDQLRVCRQYIDAQGDVLLPEHIFSDAAVSGASEAGRDGFLKAKSLICQRNGPIDQLVVADLSRLTRDLADMTGLLRDLSYYGVDLIGVADGIGTGGASAKMAIVFKSLMNEMYLTDLAKKTREGQVGQAQRGFSTGGRTFGFGTKPTVVPGLDNKTNAKPFIIEEEAEVVRRAYALASNGHSIETIVADLNANRAPCPDPGVRTGRPKGWSYSSMRAVLRNPKYRGTWIFSQSRFVKDPRTGKRQRRMLDKTHWQVSERPELAIVSRELFDSVQAVLDQRGEKYKRSTSGRLAGSTTGTTRASYLLSGLAICGECGRAMSIYGGKRSPDRTKVYRGYRCPTAHRSGPKLCTNTLTISKDKLEAAVVEAVLAQLLSEEALVLFEDSFRSAYEAALKNDAREARRETVQRELGAVNQVIERLLNALEAGSSAAVGDRLRKAEARQADLQRELESLMTADSAPLPELASSTIRAALNELRRLLDSDPTDSKALLKRLFGELRLSPKKTETETPTGARSAWVYEVSGSAFPQNLLIPLRGGVQDGLSEIAGAPFTP